MKKNKKRITRTGVLLGIGMIVLIVCVFLYAFIFNYTNKASVPSVIETAQETVIAPAEAPETQEPVIVPAEKPENVTVRDVPIKDKVHGITEDKKIFLKWELPVEDAILTIRSEDGNEYTEQVKGTDTYSFTNGVHGLFYVFDLHYKLDEEDFAVSVRRKFLDFDQLPSLMTLFINTEDGRDPYYERSSAKQEGLFGLTIEKNDFKNATINKEIPIKIKVRGNSSTYGPKKSYKIVLEEAKDMLDMGEEYADKEWLLLGKSSVQTYLGFQIGLFAGMEWEPRMRFVNVMLNGDWKGLYVLCESIKKHPKRVAIDEDGFLIESDGYFWKEKNPVLDSNLLSNKVKFTFKYPKPTTKSDERFIAIEKRIQEIEYDINGWFEEELADLIDFDIFASWLLAHEIMGTSDGYGSNMFFYQKNFNKGTKLKMGPTWDFDTMFFEPNGGHSKFWTLNSVYFTRLLEFQSFKDVFKEKFFAAAPIVEQKMRESLEKLKDIPGLKESMMLDRFRARKGGNLDAEIDRLLRVLHDRIEVLSKTMQHI
ncbi:MAG: CotH kinase family protein [Alphaproteobacteria bacterium]|nr:CotH kinase family protein [Alphaproteobacteria bacterium]